MITWLQNVTQKHNKILFSVLLVVIIVAFVFTIGNFSGGSRGGGGAPVEARLFYGFDMNNMRQQQAIEQQTRLSLLLYNNRNAYNTNAVEQASFERMVLTHLANQLQIPEPSEDQLIDFVRTLPAFINPQTGKFDPAQFQRQKDQYAAANVSMDFVDSVILQDYRLRKVRELLSGPGYVLPYEGRLELERRNTKWDYFVAELKRADVDLTVDLADEKLADYYERNQFRYEIAPFVEFDAVNFVAENYVSDVEDTPSESDLQQVYNQNLSDWPKGEDDATKPLADIREQVVEVWKLEQAKALAMQAATELSGELVEAAYREQISHGSDSLNAFLAERGLTREPVAKISRTKPEAVGDYTQAVVSQVAALTANRFFTAGTETDDGAVIFLFREEIPARVPPLADVRTQVEKDFTEEEKDRLFAEAYAEMGEKLKAAVADGEDFKEVAEASNLTVIFKEDYNLNSPPIMGTGLNPFLKDAMSTMEAGEVSHMIPYQESASAIYVVDKTLTEAEAGSEQLDNVMRSIEPRFSKYTYYGIITSMIEAGRKQAGLTEDT